MASKKSLCQTVAQGGVGESGASSQLIHQVNGSSSKMLVLRTVETSLCPNTGAAAMLLVNGSVAASGVISADKSFIQAEAPAGAHVTAIVHTYPMFNEILCVRLGELKVQLDECDLEAVKDQKDPGLSTRDWYAWNDKEPPGPFSFHLTGEVLVANPGVQVLLTPTIPQGINPKILLLDLHLIQLPGIWPQVQVWKQARYNKENATYEQATVLFQGKPLANVNAQDVH